MKTTSLQISPPSRKTDLCLSLLVFPFPYNCTSMDDTFWLPCIDTEPCILCQENVSRVTNIISNFRNLKRPLSFSKLTDWMQRTKDSTAGKDQKKEGIWTLNHHKEIYPPTRTVPWLRSKLVQTIAIHAFVRADCIILTKNRCRLYFYC